MHSTNSLILFFSILYVLRITHILRIIDAQSVPADNITMNTRSFNLRRNSMNYMIKSTVMFYNTHVSIGKSEHELEAVLFGIRVPVGPIPVASIISFVLNFTSRYPERNGLVRFGSNLCRIVS